MAKSHVKPQGETPWNLPHAVLWLVFALTSVQVLWDWLRSARLLTLLNMVGWGVVLVGIALYAWLLRGERRASSVMRLHAWLYQQIRRTRVMGFALLSMTVFIVWYAVTMRDKLLGSFDIGAQLYRFLLLDQIAPELVAYNPLVNAGYTTLDAVVTGTYNLLLLSYPFLLLFPPDEVFKFLPAVLVVLLPVLTFVSGKCLGYGASAALLPALFALVITMLVHEGFMDLLFTGILPFTLSCEIAMLVFALGYRVFVRDKGAVWGIPLIIGLGSLGSFHPLFGLVMGPVFLAVVWRGTISTIRKVGFCVLIGASLLILNRGEITAILAYKSGSLVSQTFQLAPQPWSVWLAKLEQHLFGLRIALVIGGLVGLRTLWRAPKGSERRRLGEVLLCTIIYFVGMILVGNYLLTELQPFHFVTPLSFFFLLGLGAAWPQIRRLWTKMEHHPNRASYQSNAMVMGLALFLCLPYPLYLVGYPTLSNASRQMVEWFRTHGSDDGRIFFFKPVRRLDGSVVVNHVLTGRPVMGAVPHVDTDAVVDIAACLIRPRSPLDCRELYNIHYVVTFSNPMFKGIRLPQDEHFDGFAPLQTFGGRIRIYKNQSPSSYFLVGRGAIRQHLNHLAVTVDPSEFVVLKFFWVPGLQTIPPLTLEPVSLPNGEAFIKVHTNYRQHFDLVYRAFKPTS